jgi:hypothetical protein
MTEVPSAVAAALVETGAPPTLGLEKEALSSDVLVGDVRVVKALSYEGTDRRLVLVSDVDPVSGSAEVHLVHSSPELATSRDVVVEADLVGAPYVVVVETDLRAVVWSFQLDRRVGHMDEEVLEMVKILGSDRSDLEPSADQVIGSQVVYCGTEMTGALDGRWPFKEVEGSVLRRFAADCTEALLDQDVVWEIDENLLRPDLVSQVDDGRLLEEFIHWVGTRRLSLPEDLGQLFDGGLVDATAWAEFDDLALDLVASLLNPVGAVGMGTGDSDASPGLLASAQLGAVETAGHVGRVRYLGSSAKEPVAS